MKILQISHIPPSADGGSDRYVVVAETALDVPVRVYARVTTEDGLGALVDLTGAFEDISGRPVTLDDDERRSVLRALAEYVGDSEF